MSSCGSDKGPSRWRKRSDQFHQGQRNALKWAVTWLHREARSMQDPSARALLDGAAFGLGVEAKRRYPDLDDPPEESPACGV